MYLLKLHTAKNKNPTPTNKRDFFSIKNHHIEILAILFFPNKNRHVHCYYL